MDHTTRILLTKIIDCLDEQKKLLEQILEKMDGEVEKDDIDAKRRKEYVAYVAAMDDFNTSKIVQQFGGWQGHKTP